MADFELDPREVAEYLNEMADRAGDRKWSERHAFCEKVAEWLRSEGNWHVCYGDVSLRAAALENTNLTESADAF